VIYFSRLRRLLQIYFVIVRYNLDALFYEMPLFAPFRCLRFLNPLNYRRHKLTRGARLRLALIALGPIFIKAGQIISTRRDLIPDDIAKELSLLQDKVPPFKGELALKIIEESLGAPITDYFDDFNAEALASASIAQVHTAKLKNQRAVVIKILRPGIVAAIARDLDLLALLARFGTRYSKAIRFIKPEELVAEIAQTLNDELDLLREGANASQLRRNFANSSLLYIPEIYWEVSRPNMLVLERIEGIPIYAIENLRSAGFDMKTLAERGIELFFTQVFRDSFFHADMHPGNIFVSLKNLKQPQYIAVDFGIVGSLSHADQRYLADNLLAFFKRDYQRVAELHIASGWLPPHTRVDLFEGAIRAVCEPIFERPLKDISFGQLLLRLFQTARQFQINIQPQLILLQKTLVNIEGIGRQLYPDLDLWGNAAPFLEKWIKRQVGGRAFLRRIHENLPYWSEKLPELPGLIYEILQEKRLKYEEARFYSPPQQKPAHFLYFLLGIGVASLLFLGWLLS
jgi:ubiquinone biosynthesis protein